jgi:CO dehydrogenase/acetyl-CoA synthase beta subunit
MLHNAAEPEKASSTTLATFNEDSADSYISAIEEGEEEEEEEEEEPTEENGEPKRFPKITIHIGAIPPEENANLEVAQEGPVKCIINRALIQDEDSNLSTKSARSGTRAPSSKRMANITVANGLGHAGHQE